MKKLLLFTFILFFLIFGCNSTEPVKLGFLGTLSGNSAELGTSARNSVRLAIEEINSNGGINGRKVELFIADDKGNPEDGLAATEYLLQEKVVAVIGPSITGSTALSVPYLNQNKILMLSPSVSTSELSGIDDNFIKMATSNIKQAEALADFAINDQKFNNFVIIYDLNNKGYSEGIVNRFAQIVNGSGKNIVLKKTFNSGDYKKITEIIDTLRNLKFDAILSIASGMDNAVLCQLLKKEKLNFPVLTGIWAATDDLINSGGAAVEKIVTINSFNWNDSSRTYQNFKKKYLQKYKEEPSFASVFAYEAAQILFTAMQKSSSFDYQQLKSNIINKEFNGLQQNIFVDEFGDVERKINLFKIQNGKFISR